MSRKQAESSGSEFLGGLIGLALLTYILDVGIGNFFGGAIRLLAGTLTVIVLLFLAIDVAGWLARPPKNQKR
jgi:predicted lipid-binding transport protein (Tim44 family)